MRKAFNAALAFDRRVTAVVVAMAMGIAIICMISLGYLVGLAVMRMTRETEGRNDNVA